MDVELIIRKMTSEDMPKVRQITGEVFRPVAIVAKIEDEFGKIGHDWLDPHNLGGNFRIATPKSPAIYRHQ